MPTIAIIGTGTMGTAHAKAWAALGHAEDVRYVCSPSGETLADAPAARRVELDTILADAQVDVLSVCTPTDTHLDIARRALAAGKHVLLEKPLALTVQEGEALCDLAETAGRVLMIAHVVRFFPGYRRLAELVRAGTVGPLRAARAARISGAGPRPDWVLDEERSGGMLVEFAIHDFDQLGLLLGPATAVRAVRLNGGTVETSIEHGDGVLAHVISEMAMPEGFPFTTSLEVMGERGLAGYFFSAGPSGRSELEVVTTAGSRAEAVDPGDPFADQARYFLDCVAGSRRPVDGAVGPALAALRVARAAREALISGERVVLAADS